jgi:hypothetical protein
MEKRLLLDGVVLHAGYVAPWNVEDSVPVETDLADAGLAFRNGTAVPAGIAADALIFQRFPQVAFADMSGENLR